MSPFFRSLVSFLIFLVGLNANFSMARQVYETYGAEKEAIEQEDFLFRATRFMMEMSKTNPQMKQGLDRLKQIYKTDDLIKIPSHLIHQMFTQLGGDVDALPCYPGESKDAIAKRVFKCGTAAVEPQSNAKMVAWKATDYVIYLYKDGKIQFMDDALKMKIYRESYGGGNLTQKYIQIMMLPRPDVDRWGFSAQSRYELSNPQQKPNNQNNNPQASQGSITVAFAGRCSALVKLDLTVSANGGDVYTLIRNPVDAMRLALKDQCPNLEGVQLHIKTGTGNYIASSLAENNWKIESGAGQSSHEKDLVVNLNVASDNASPNGYGAIGTVIKIPCTVNATLPLDFVQITSSDAYNPDHFSINTFLETAEKVGKYYATQCPSTETVTYYVRSSLPQRYECLDTEKCIVVSKSDNWKASTAAMKQKPAPVVVQVSNIPHKECLSSFLFCDLPAGDYLGVVADENAEAVYVFDPKYMKLSNKISDPLKRSPIFQLFNSLTGNQLSHHDPVSFGVLAQEYMYQYGELSKRCLRSDYKPQRRVEHVPETRTQIFDGYLGGIPQYHDQVSPGYDIESVAHINTEFVPLCDLFCTPRGAASSSLVPEDLSQIVSGVHQLMQTYACDSPEVKQFERGMLSVYKQIYVDKTTAHLRPLETGAAPVSKTQFAGYRALREKVLGAPLLKTPNADLYSNQINTTTQRCTPGTRNIVGTTPEYEAALAKYNQIYLPFEEKQKRWHEELSKVKDAFDRESVDAYSKHDEKRLAEIRKRYIDPLGPEPQMPAGLVKPKKPEINVPALNLVVLVRTANDQTPILQTTPAYEKDKFPINGHSASYYRIAPEEVAKFNQTYFPVIEKFCPTLERVSIQLGFDDVLTLTGPNLDLMYYTTSATLWFHKTKNGWQPEQLEDEPNIFFDHPQWLREIFFNGEGFTKKEVKNAGPRHGRIYWQMP